MLRFGRADAAPDDAKAMTQESPKNIRQILSLEVPLVVRLGDRPMLVRDVVALVPGSIIELPKPADAELELLVNDKLIGQGVAVKVGENFGLRITFIGEPKDRVAAMGALELEAESSSPSESALASAEPVPA
jgi:flagellar motor switch protein FliN/FliY